MSTISVTSFDELWSAEVRRAPPMGVEPSAIHEAFDLRARGLGDRPALFFGAETWTFRDLHDRSIRLARALVDGGVHPGDRVAVCLPRTPRLSAVLLAVLRTGGLYVPLDRNYPRERLEYMLADSDAKVLVTDRGSPALEVPTTVERLDVETLIRRAARHPVLAPQVTVRPESGAYVIYTSGSTGRPKGVIGLHGATMNRLTWMERVFPFHPGELACHKTPLSFVDSVAEIFGPLCAGVPAVVVDEETSSDPELLVAALDEHGVSRIVVVPAVLRAMLSSLRRSRRTLDRLHICVSSGETLPREVAVHFREQLPHATLINLYGSSEVAADVTAFVLAPGAPIPEGASVPIGRGIDNVVLHVLDDRGQPVEPGAVGELYVGGAALSGGYHGRVDLTRSRFFPDVPVRPGHEPLFQTGDLVRALPSGDLIHVGRRDQLVKLNGVRVELPEIEALLREHPAVEQAVAMLRDEGAPGARLVAYVEAPGTSAAPAPTARQLHAHLSARLPAAMLPSAYVVLPALPRTPSGKIARLLLPDPANAIEPVEPAATPMEVRLARAFVETLGIAAIGRNESFFLRGGSSLGAATMLARLRAELGLDLRVRDFYASPSVAELARLVEQRTPAPAEALTARLERDAVLPAWSAPAAIAAKPRVPAPEARTLLTGATGFFGAHLLQALLARYSGRVTCLVRAPTPEAGQARVLANLKRLGLDATEAERRVDVVVGALEAPRLGLAVDAYERLAEETELIVHNGAQVDFLRPYAQLAEPNVVGTAEVLAFAHRGGAIPVQFVSTLAVADTPGVLGGAIVGEGDRPAPGDAPLTGYAQSKWVAERLVLEAAARGLPVAVFRPDDLAGPTTDALPHAGDLLWRWLEGCVELGVAPAMDTIFRMVPVDRAARAIVAASAQPRAQGLVFHLTSPEPIGFATFVGWLRELGYRIDLEPVDAWKVRMSRLAASAPECALAPIASIFVDPVAGDRTLVEAYDRALRPRYGMSTFEREIGPASSVLGGLDRERFFAQIAALERAGHFPAPRAPAAFRRSVETIRAARRVDEGVQALRAGLDGRVASSAALVPPEHTSIPDGPAAIGPYFEGLFERFVDDTVRTHSPRFIGHMTSALPWFVEPIAQVLAATNQNVVKLETSNAFTFAERQVLAMLHEAVFALPREFYETHAQRSESTLGSLLSGGTLANLAGLWCARNLGLGPMGGSAGVEADGLAAALEAHGHRRAVIVGSELMHYSFDKAVDLLGFGRDGLVKVPCDVDGRIDLSLLHEVLDACDADGTRVVALVGIAGTTETGAIDPLEALGHVARSRRIHFHVDAAWGGPTVLSQRYADRLRGIEGADSVVIDGHKQLYLPMGTGVLLFRDPLAAKAIEKTARYIIRDGSSDLGRRTLEGSREASALHLHAALHLLGRRGYASLVDGGIERCAHLAAEIERRRELELLGPPTLNILVFRYLPPQHRGPAAPDAAANRVINAINVAIQEGLRDSDRGFVSRTTLSHTRHGAQPPIVALRVVLASPLTEERDISAVLAELIARGDAASATSGAEARS